jgi:hypothetical protein
MVALVVVVTFVVLILGVLVAGLLRSHADILRSLHDLGVGVGDPALPENAGVVTSASGGSTSPVLSGQSLVGAAVPDVAGVTPAGDARAVSVSNSDQLTLLAFLSSGCTTCSGFWHELQSSDHLGFPDRVRSVIVTKGPELEIPSEVASKTTGRIPVVMSTEAWLDYQVPGSPFFVLVDGSTGRRVGHGVANQVGQLVDLVRRAEQDANGSAAPQGGRRIGTRLDGPAREASADEVLLAAGIRPGDPSLYPKTLEDVFPHGQA